MTAKSQTPPWQDPLCVLAISLAGLTLRLYRIFDRGFWKDEVEFFFTCFSNFHLRQNAPLTVFIHRAFIDLTGTADSFSLRLPSLVFGTLLIPAVFVLGRMLAGRAVAYVAACLTVLSPMALYYSQEGRPYAMFQFVSALVLIAFLQAYSTRKGVWWVVYSALLVVAGMTHMLAIHVATGLAAFVGWDALRGKIDADRWPRLAKFTVATAVGLAAGLTWIFPRKRSVVAVLNGVYPSSFSSFAEAALGSIGPYFNCGRIPLAKGWLIASLIVMLFAVAGAIYLRNQRVRSFALLAPCLFGTTLLAHWYTLGVKAWWIWPRYLSHLLPLYLVLIAAGWEAMYRSRVLRAVGISTLALLFIVGAIDWAKALTWNRSVKVANDAKLVEANRSILAGVVLVEVRSAADYMVTSTWGLHARRNLPTFLIRKQGTIAGTHWTRLDPPAPPLLLPTDEPAVIPAGSYAVVDIDSILSFPGCEVFAPVRGYTCVEDPVATAKVRLRVLRISGSGK